MSAASQRLLARLEESRRLHGPGCAQQVAQFLLRLRFARWHDGSSLLRWHDALLFLRAFPQSKEVARLADELLATTSARVARLQKADADLSLLDDESVSGIAGAEIVESWEFSIAQWLAAKYPNHVGFYWEGELNAARMANTLSRVIPLLDEDATVEPDVPWREWIDAARGKQNEVRWLTDRFAALDLPDKLRAELYESLELPI